MAQNGLRKVKRGVNFIMGNLFMILMIPALAVGMVSYERTDTGWGMEVAAAVEVCMPGHACCPAKAQKFR